MKLQCPVCKEGFTPFERFVKIESWLQTESGTKQGVCFAVHAYHLPKEMLDFLMIGEGSFKDSSLQVKAEEYAFRKNRS